MVWDRALAMICDENGNLEPAWIKIENNTITEIEERGKLISVSDMILDMETAKEGNIGSFQNRLAIFADTVQDFVSWISVIIILRHLGQLRIYLVKEKRETRIIFCLNRI